MNLLKNIHSSGIIFFKSFAASSATKNSYDNKPGEN